MLSFKFLSGIYLLPGMRNNVCSYDDNSLFFFTVTKMAKKIKLNREDSF